MLSKFAFCIFQTVVCSLVVDWLTLLISRLDGKEKSINSKVRKISAEVSGFFFLRPKG